MTWAGMDPNSEHQNWSYWRFEIHEAGRHVPQKDVEYNAAQWLRMGFGSVGQARVTSFAAVRRDGTAGEGWQIEARVEGESAADPVFVASVRSAFRDFVRKGWGLAATAHLAEARVLAGDVDDQPPSQLIVMSGE